MSEEPKKNPKTTAEDAASAASAAGEAKPLAKGGDAAPEAGKAAGKDEDKKKDDDRKKDKKKDKDKKRDQDEKQDEDEEQDEDEKQDEDKKQGRNRKKAKDKKGRDPGEAKAPGLPFKIPESAILAATIVVSLAAGSLLGSLLIAPQVIAARNARPATPAKVEKAEDGGEAQESEDKTGDSKKGVKEKAAVYSIDNIVVNPAGSAGTRFLMASVAFELPDEKAVAVLREKEVQIRDAVITTLESQTLEMLAAPGAREGIKRQLAVAIQPLVPGHRQVRVYLPQFVLQ